MAKRRRSGRILIFIALILIGIVALVWVVSIRGIGVQPKPSGVAQPTPIPQDMIDIVMTTQDIPRGKEINESLIATVKIPRKDFVEGSFFNETKEVIGSRAKDDLKAHTPLNEALIVLPGMEGSIPAFDIPKGMVAISIPIGKLSSVSYALQKGDHVNVIASLLLVDLDMNFQTKLPNRTGVVIAPGPVNPENQTYVTATTKGGDETGAGETFSMTGRIELDPVMNHPIYMIPAESQRPRLVSQTLIQDAAVLQMGYSSTSQNNVAPEEEAPQTNQQQQNTAVQGQQTTKPTTNAIDVVTLIVTPQDAVTLNYLMLSGANLNLVMRSAGDDQKIAMEAVTLQFVLNQYNIPSPAKLPYGVEPRMEKFPTKIEPFPDPGLPGPTPTPVR